MSEEIKLMMRQVKLGGMAREWRSVQFENATQYVTDLLKLELRERQAKGDPPNSGGLKAAHKIF